MKVGLTLTWFSSWCIIVYWYSSNAGIIYVKWTVLVVQFLQNYFGLYPFVGVTVVWLTSSSIMCKWPNFDGCSGMILMLLPWSKIITFLCYEFDNFLLLMDCYPKHTSLLSIRSNTSMTVISGNTVSLKYDLTFLGTFYKHDHILSVIFKYCPIW